MAGMEIYLHAFILVAKIINRHVHTYKCNESYFIRTKEGQTVITLYVQLDKLAQIKTDKYILSLNCEDPFTSI